jgi:dUTP pyrophosphatase
VAQLVFTPVSFPDCIEVEELTDTVRGDGGFGSTGA